ncbi:hypothetical protein ElyMa_003788700 [Elysia marginata]|uniref:Uncharacterized protein n=1 Tax=Elysia marginata TaxID=1093978 RepID=A0AAV4FBZ6_9GAST|nr:hypothetical protein ElyMa_003788700 [Elysia marginata]
MDQSMKRKKRSRKETLPGVGCSELSCQASWTGVVLIFKFENCINSCTRSSSPRDLHLTLSYLIKCREAFIFHAPLACPSLGKRKTLFCVCVWWGRAVLLLEHYKRKSKVCGTSSTIEPTQEKPIKVNKPVHFDFAFGRRKNSQWREQVEGRGTGGDYRSDSQTQR